LEDLFQPRQTWVITSAAYLDQVAEQLPDLPRENLIGEPLSRDTANAIGLAANLLALRDADATMAVFTADHIIDPQDRFAAAIRLGLAAAEQSPDSLITFGVQPRSPHTGYGYLLRGQPVADRTYRVTQFKEKPTPQVAQEYVTSGQYLWNSGMFAWRASTILRELGRLLPENADTLRRLAAEWDRLAGTPAATERFSQLHRISIDYGVMEKATSVLVVEMDCRWIDVGSWAAVAALHEPDQAGNVHIAAQALTVDGTGNLLVGESDHLIVALGVSDLVVVHSPDATLVCRRDQAERLKELAALRVARFGQRFE